MLKAFKKGQPGATKAPAMCKVREGSDHLGLNKEKIARQK